jgi:glycosyltransferase involved in cell wall biosynthesis
LSNEWVGGTNYIVNLLHAVHALPAREIEPVVFVSPRVPSDLLLQLPPIEIVRSPIVDNKYKFNYLRKAAAKVLHHDYAMEYFLKSHNIAVLSHHVLLGSGGQLPTIPWIPDFQHRHLAQFFEAKEVALRDRQTAFTCKHARLIVVSSFDVRRDLAEFDPGSVSKSRVLHFVSGFGAASSSAVSLGDLQARFRFAEPYFHLPNQFWAHKNHALVIEALALAKARGRRILVLATGHTRDRRQPEHFEKIMRLVRDRDIEDLFRVLGLVSYTDLVNLMRHAVGVINPSFFEGWSTSVEEAKSLGKTILLSDLPVHREQAPEFASFFSPNDPSTLADIMIETLDGYSFERDAKRQVLARQMLPERVNTFAKAYERIALDACVGGRQATTVLSRQ